MGINELKEKMEDSEREVFDNKSTSDYFRYFYYSESFARIQEKLDSNEKLTKEEWDFLLSKLYLVTYKAISEEDTITIADRIRYLFSKLVIKVSREDGPMHSECFRMIEFVNSIYNEKDINCDLLEGFDIVRASMDEEDLIILLKQQRVASVFRDNQDSFCITAVESNKSSISQSERISINLMDRAYIKEKELVKAYKE